MTSERASGAGSTRCDWRPTAAGADDQRPGAAHRGGSSTDQGARGARRRTGRTVLDLCGDGGCSQALAGDTHHPRRSGKTERAAGGGCPPGEDGVESERGSHTIAEFTETLERHLFEGCAAGPAVSYDPQNLPENWPLSPDSNGIIAPDFDRDRDIDLRDFAIFENSMIGP